MDQSYNSHFQIGPFDNDIQLQEYLESQFGIECNFQQTRYSWDSTINDAEDNLIAPCHILCTDKTLIICVHPSVTAEVREILSTGGMSAKQRCLNRFTIYSKNVALQHLYSVLEPLC
jgi:hypothetical protein